MGRFPNLCATTCNSTGRWWSRSKTKNCPSCSATTFTASRSSRVSRCCIPVVWKRPCGNTPPSMTPSAQGICSTSTTSRCSTWKLRPRSTWLIWKKAEITTVKCACPVLPGQAHPVRNQFYLLPLNSQMTSDSCRAGRPIRSRIASEGFLSS